MLPTLVDSILAVKDDRFDLCVTDDGSTDGTYEWLQQRGDDRLHVFRNEKNMHITTLLSACIMLMENMHF
jgi:glycosyltransferase involved in cell wall biosynthesis